MKAGDTGSGHPGTDPAGYFPHTFKHSRTYDQLPLQREGISLAAKQSSELGPREGSVISIRMDSVIGGCKIHGASFIGMGS